MIISLFRKKGDFEKIVIEGVDILLEVIEIMDNNSFNVDPFLTAKQIIDLETEFEKQNKKIMSLQNKLHNFPICWEEILEVNNCIKQLLNKFIMIFNKNQIFKNTEVYSSFYEHEKRFLINIKSILTEYTGNKKYVYQVIVNNDHELKDFMKIYYARLNSVYNESIEILDIRLKILELFEQINSINEELQGIIGKIYISTNI